MLAILIRAEKTTNFEGWAYGRITENMFPGLTMFMKGISRLGNTTSVIVLCLLMFMIPKLRKSVAMPVALTVISSAIMNVALKHLFARNRPDILRLISETGYSFPSGHAMNNGALYIMLAMLILKHGHHKTQRIILSSLCIIIAILIGYSRVYLGVHYAGDVIGGWLFGFAISLLIYFLWEGSGGSKDKSAEKK